jgi:hypothetical protein
MEEKRNGGAGEAADPVNERTGASQIWSGPAACIEPKKAARDAVKIAEGTQEVKIKTNQKKYSQRILRTCLPLSFCREFSHMHGALLPHPIRFLPPLSHARDGCVCVKQLSAWGAAQPGERQEALRQVSAQIWAPDRKSRAYPCLVHVNSLTYPSTPTMQIP